MAAGEKNNVMHTRSIVRHIAFLAVTAAVLALSACGGNPPPASRPAPPPPPPPTAPPPPPPITPMPIPDPVPIPAEPVEAADSLETRSLDELNRESPLVPVFYAYDSSEIGPDAQRDLQRNADLLRQYASWVITIEGHCDERGTAEYNLALGERRALSSRDYLVTLGIPGDRLRTVSYGKEFPFDQGQNEEAWQRNRRAHFVITAR